MLTAKIVEKLLEIEDFKKLLDIIKEVNKARREEGQSSIGFESVMGIYINYLIVKNKKDMLEKNINFSKY